jgi:hypothetical protein
MRMAFELLWGRSRVVYGGGLDRRDAEPTASFFLLH